MCKNKKVKEPEHEEEKRQTIKKVIETREEKEKERKGEEK